VPGGRSYDIGLAKAIEAGLLVCPVAEVGKADLPLTLWPKLEKSGPVLGPLAETKKCGVVGGKIRGPLTHDTQKQGRFKPIPRCPVPGAWLL
jgi:hypothetical protein